MLTHPLIKEESSVEFQNSNVVVERALVEIALLKVSPTFFEQLLRQLLVPKKLPSLIVST